MPNQLWADAFVVRSARTKEAWRYIKAGWNVWRGVTGSNVQVQVLVKRRRCRDRSHTTVPSPSKPQFLSLWARSLRKKIKWPPANNKGAWQDFDNDICEIIQSATKGDMERQLSFMTTIITSLASERFGRVEPWQPRMPYTANRRVNKMKDLRREIRSLKKLYKKASIEERQPLEELWGTLRGELKTLRRAEWHRRRRKERSRKWANFLSNPFGFARTLLGRGEMGIWRHRRKKLTTIFEIQWVSRQKSKKWV